MSQQLAVYQSAIFGGLTEQDAKTIHETIAKDCNESQFKLFMAIAKAADANPILGEIYPTVYQGKLTTQFGIEYHAKKAKETEGYLGYDVQLVHENDEFEMHQERAEDGRYFVVIDIHKWKMPRGKVIGGYAFAYKQGLQPFSVIMEVDEVQHYKNSQIGMQKTMWNNNFNDMFKKHMVKRALKAAFGLRFDDEEPSSGVSNLPEYKENQRKDITAEVEAAETGAPARKQAAPPDDGPKPLDDDPAPADPEVEKLLKDIEAAFAKLGITDKTDRGVYAREHGRFKATAPTKTELKALLKVMKLHIEDKEIEEATRAVADGEPVLEGLD